MERFSIEWNRRSAIDWRPPVVQIHANLGAINWARTAAPTSFHAYFCNESISIMAPVRRVDPGSGRQSMAPLQVAITKYRYKLPLQGAVDYFAAQDGGLNAIFSDVLLGGGEDVLAQDYGIS